VGLFELAPNLGKLDHRRLGGVSGAAQGESADYCCHGDGVNFEY
jgi:hypothetical protein